MPPFSSAVLTPKNQHYLNGSHLAGGTTRELIFVCRHVYRTPLSSAFSLRGTSWGSKDLAQACVFTTPKCKCKHGLGALVTL